MLKRDGNAYKLNEALYSLKQAGRQWHARLSRELKGIGLQPGGAEICLYHAMKGREILLLKVYIDDFLVASSDIEWVEEVKCKL